MSARLLLLLQLSDGAFPSGGFAHSHGLEAALQLRGLDRVDAFLDEVLLQVGHASLPFVREACEGVALARVDDLYDATTTSHVQNRASRAQGRALAVAASQIWTDERVARVAAHARSGPAHHAPIFGALFGALGASPREAEIAYLHGAARGVLSAGVRLGLLGPLEAQSLQAERAARMDQIIASCTHLTADDAAQTAPLVELFGALHDRLDGRLFQS
ncbi:MAG: urease accessory protein UreF [Labilithrix sp.]|nr:urease accessory protein UreF [Labilithrix sp.]